MKNYIGLAAVLGAMILSGCAGALPPPEEPTGVVTITSAELSTRELASSPYERDLLPSWWTEDPWGPSVHKAPAPLPDEDPWAEAATAKGGPVAQTWGKPSAVEYGF